jgi:hypothetical protein
MSRVALVIAFVLALIGPASAQKCPFRGDHIKALQWCQSQCVQVPLPDKTGFFHPIDSYSICRNSAYSCAIRNSQC